MKTATAIGLFLIFTGTAGWIVGGYLVYVILQLIGTAVLLEGLLFTFGIHAHWKKAADYLKHLFYLVALGTVTGVLIFDVAGILVFKLWEYPYFSPLINLGSYLSVAPSWGIYFLVFHQSYLLLMHFLHFKNLSGFSEHQSALFKFIAPAGIVLMGMGFAMPQLSAPPALAGITAFVGVWFVLEGLEFPRKRPTLLQDIIHLRFRPLVAIFIGAVVVGFISEFSNILSPIQYWIYHGIPWEHITLFGVPIFLLLSWSTMYVVFLSLENILIKPDEKIWT